MPTQPSPETCWINGRQLEQVLLIEGEPAAIVYPALNRAEIMPSKYRVAQAIAAPWSVSAFDLVEQHFDLESVRFVPTGQDEDVRAQVKGGNENFRCFVSRDEEARRSLTDAITALQNHARFVEPDARRREAQMQLERAVLNIDRSNGQWSSGTRVTVLMTSHSLKSAEPHSPEWHAWLECERALTADRLFGRDAPGAQIEQTAPEAEQTFDVFERRGQERERGFEPE